MWVEKEGKVKGRTQRGLATDCLFKNSGAATKSRVVSTTKVATPCAVLRRLTVVAGRPAAKGTAKGEEKGKDGNCGGCRWIGRRIAY